jgi:triacylglycerol lipase
MAKGAVPSRRTMIAFCLRSATLAILAVASLVYYRTADATIAALVFLGTIVLLNTIVVAASFVVSRWHSMRPAPQPASNVPAGILIFLREWLASLFLFFVVQQFDRIWMGDDAPPRVPPSGVPVLLVHGYKCNRGLWWWMGAKLRAAGFTIATINLEPPGGSIDVLADQLHARIEALCRETQAAQLALVCHSMGGLVARAYLRKHGPARIANLVTLASPHHGTWIARLGFGENARQMQPGSTWLRRLEQSELTVPTLSIWSPADNFIAPQDSSRLAGSRERIVPALGHLTMLLSPRILAILVDELTHRGGPSKMNAVQ